MAFKKIIFVFTMIGAVPLSFAQTTQDFNVSLGLENGVAHEYVLDKDTGINLSHLKWEIKNIPILIFNYRYNYGNFESSLKFNTKVIKNNSGLMKDYDYALPEAENNPNLLGIISDFSENKNDLKKLFYFDISTTYWFRHNNNFKTGPTIGFKYDYLKFKAFSGTQFSYDQYGNITNVIPGLNKESIIYSQKFLVPYIGYNLQYTYHNVTLNFGVTGSRYVHAKAFDRHLERGFNQGIEKYRKIKFLNAVLQGSYSMTNALQITTGAQYNKYFKNTNSKAYLTNDDGTTEQASGEHGISKKTITYFIGLNYRF